MKFKITTFSLIILAALVFAGCGSNPKADGTITVVVNGVTPVETFSALAASTTIGANSGFIIATDNSVTLPLYEADPVPTTTKRVFPYGTFVGISVYHIGTSKIYTTNLTIDGDITITIDYSQLQEP